MNCKYLKKKLNGKLECKLDKNKIIPKNCANCTLKEIKRTVKPNLLCKNQFPVKGKTMKQKSSKLAKLERNRFSLFTNNLNKCYFCPNKKDHMHEIFSGSRRQVSMKYGLCLPICESCHSKYQNNKQFNDKWHKKGQTKFEEVYPDLDFRSIFGKKYK